MLSSWTSFLGLIKCNLVSIFRFTQTTAWSDRKIICAAAVTGSFNSDGDFNPYEVKSKIYSVISSHFEI